MATMARRPGRRWGVLAMLPRVSVRRPVSIVFFLSWELDVTFVFQGEVQARCDLGERQTYTQPMILDISSWGQSVSIQY